MIEQELRERADRRDAKLGGRSSLTSLMRQAAAEIERLKREQKDD